MEVRMERFNTEATHALRAYLIELLLEEQWCKARTVGRALEMLVNLEGESPSREPMARGNSGVREERR